MTFRLTSKLVAASVLLVGACTFGGSNGVTKYTAGLTFIDNGTGQPASAIMPLKDTKEECEKSQAIGLEEGKKMLADKLITNLAISQCVALVLEKV